MTSRRSVYVIGVGMTKFEKPGARDNFDYPDMAREAVTKALKDAGITYGSVQEAFVGYCYGDSTCGQRALYPFGMTGIPIVNVNNNCSTGSTALYLARKAIIHGDADCVLAVGFEKMQTGSLTSNFADRTNPLDKHVEAMSEKRGLHPSALTPQIFGNAGIEHMEKYGTLPEHFAKIGYKNHKHSVRNPYSQFRKEYTLEEIQKSRQVFGPLTLLQCCPTSDGSACVILASEAFVKKNHLEQQSIRIDAMSLVTDTDQTLSGSDMAVAGYDMSKQAARQAYEEARITAQDVQMVELHDCFSANELISYEALGLCAEGQAKTLIDRGDVTFGGKYVVNPSGGLISKGHPLGATGLAQCCEITWQLRGWCGDRQVPRMKYGLQHNIGLGGAVVVGIYSRAFEQAGTPPSKLGYNPATECRPISVADYESVSVLRKPAKKSVENATKTANDAGTQQTKSAVGPGGPVKIPGFQSSFIFEQLKSQLSTLSTEKKQAILSQLKGIFQFDLKNKDGHTAQWTLLLTDDVVNVQGGAIEQGGKPDLLLSWSDDQFVAMVAGETTAMKGFMQGQLKVKGNVGLAAKLETLLKQFKLQAKL